eukprot:gene3379-13415_t
MFYVNQMKVLMTTQQSPYDYKETPDDYKAKYAVDHVFYVDEMKGWLESESAPHLHVMLGVNTDSGLEVKPASFDGVDSFVLEKDVLFDAWCVAKDPLNLQQQVAEDPPHLQWWVAKDPLNLQQQVAEDPPHLQWWVAKDPLNLQR